MLDKGSFDLTQFFSTCHFKLFFEKVKSIWEFFRFPAERCCLMKYCFWAKCMYKLFLCQNLKSNEKTVVSSDQDPCQHFFPVMRQELFPFYYSRASAKGRGGIPWKKVRRKRSTEEESGSWKKVFLLFARDKRRRKKKGSFAVALTEKLSAEHHRLIRLRDLHHGQDHVIVLSSSDM